jgi:hypothetical protein
MKDRDNAVKSLLHPSEELRVACEALLLSVGKEQGQEENMTEDIQNTRVLAVVSHRDDRNIHQEGWYVSSVLHINPDPRSKEVYVIAQNGIHNSCSEFLWPRVGGFH